MTRAQLLTPDEVADRFQISRRHVLLLARNGELPSVAVGRLIRFEGQALDEWLDAARRNAKPNGH